MKPTLINNLEFAKNTDAISHDIKVDSCLRLSEFITHDASQASSIHYTLKGSESQFHLPSLALSIKAKLSVLCQRCLKPMWLDIDLAFQYVVADKEPLPFEGDEEVDWVESAREMNVNNLVEDELLIAMPLGPLHTHACTPLVKESLQKPNPFAVLKGLIK